MPRRARSVCGRRNVERNLALASAGAKPAASSVYSNGTSDLHKLEHVNDGRYGNARSWISAEAGAGWVQIELAKPATIERVVWARDRDGKYRDRLATRYKIEVSLDGDAWQTVADGDDREAFSASEKTSQSPSTAGLPAEIAGQVAALRARAKALSEEIARLKPAEVYSGTFKQPEPTHLLYRGEPAQPREQVAPGALPAVAPPLVLPADVPEAQRRAALARWITSPDNPLAARVAVNRLWHYHFGQGLVRTPSDFGFGGGRPSNGELLDWLASELVDGGWRFKAIHRQIMLSSTYRQASRARAEAVKLDADNRLLWRMAPRRLEAEAIRDALLSVSGTLDLRMGGPGYDAFEPNTNYVKLYTPKRLVRAGRVAADGLPGKTADAAGRHVRRVRLPRFEPDRCRAATSRRPRCKH